MGACLDPGSTHPFGCRVVTARRNHTKLSGMFGLCSVVSKTQKPVELPSGRNGLQEKRELPLCRVHRLVRGHPWVPPWQHNRAQLELHRRGGVGWGSFPHSHILSLIQQWPCLCLDNLAVDAETPHGFRQGPGLPASEFSVRATKAPASVLP